MSEDYTAETITRDDRPGWRARIVYDTDASEPWGDALAPAMLAWHNDGHRVQWGAEVYTPKAPEVYETAWRHYGGDVELFTRYVRAFCGVTTVETISSRDGTVVIFDTPDYREHVGMTDEHLPADLTGEVAEWRAWVDGEVYGVIVERHRTGTVQWSDGDSEDAEDWHHEDSCWGFYGAEYTATEARRMLDEASTP